MSLGRNILWNLFAFFTVSVLVIFVTPFMVHRMGLDAFGIWSVLTAVTTSLFAMDLGLANAMIRYLATEHERGNRQAVEGVLRSGIAMLSGIGLLVALAFFFLAPLVVRIWLKVPTALTAEATASFRITAITAFLIFPIAGFAAVPVAVRRFDLVAARNLILYGVFYALAVAVLWSGGGLFQVAEAYMVGTLAMLVFLLIITPRLVPGVSLLPGWHGESVRELVRFGRYRFPTQVSTSLLQQFDRFAIAAILPVAQVSFYAVPARISQRVSLVVEQIAAPFYPAVTSHLAGDRDAQLADQYRHGLRLIAAVAGGAMVVLGGLAHPILSVWMGPEFGALGTWPFRILLAAYAAGALFLLPSIAAEAAGRPAIPAAFLVAGCLLHIPLVLFLTPRFGLIGTATGVLAGYLVPLTLGVREIHRRIGRLPGLIPLLREVRGVAIATVAAGTATLFLARTAFPGSGIPPLLVSMAAAGFAYLALLFTFRGIRPRDLRILAGLVTRTSP